MRSFVHDAREEEERRGGLVLLVVTLDPLLQCLVHCPGQEYLTSLSDTYNTRCRQRCSKRLKTHEIHRLQLDAARPRPSRADALLLRVLEESPGVHRTLGEHDCRRVHVRRGQRPVPAASETRDETHALLDDGAILRTLRGRLEYGGDHSTYSDAFEHICDPNSLAAHRATSC